MVEDRLAVHERLGDVVTGDHCAERRVCRGDALGGGDHVGLVAVALGAEPVADAPPRADHLIGDQQHAVAVTDLAHALEVALLRHEAAAAVLDGLEDHCGDGRRFLELDRLLDRVRGPQRVAILAPAIGVRVGHVRATGGQRLERRAQGGQAGDRQRPHRGAVVGEVARDDLVPRRRSARGVIGLRELPRRLDRLGAAGGEEDAVEVSGRQLSDARGELDRARMRVAPVGVEAELGGLTRGRLADLGATVADVDAVQRREAVEIALAVLVVDVAALAARDHGHLVIGV